MKKEAVRTLYNIMLEETCKTFNKTEADLVFGEGDLNADILLVGEAPGAEETRLKKPFVGKAGENLNEFLAAVNLLREEIYITNVVKFRPYVESETGRRRNRPPAQDEQIHQAAYLKKEIALIMPKIVVTLGNIALRNISGQKNATVGELHGKAVETGCEGHSFLLFSLYHPASIIYNRALKTVYLDDLQALKSCMQLR